MSRSAFSRVCKVVGWYGIVFGMYTVPVALFVRLQFLIGSFLHIAIGAAFLVSAAGIQNGKAWASWLTFACSVIIAGLGMVVVRDSLAPAETSNLIFYSFISLFFTCLAFVAFREVRSLALGRTRRSL